MTYSGNFDNFVDGDNFSSGGVVYGLHYGTMAKVQRTVVEGAVAKIIAAAEASMKVATLVTLAFRCCQSNCCEEDDAHL